MGGRFFGRMLSGASIRLPRVRKLEVNRTLLGDFFFLHIAIATLVGALAIGGMWWATHRVVEDSQLKWAVQWVDRLDALGSPLYVAADQSELLRIREYVASFAEIAVVRYYLPDGTLLHEERAEGHEVEIPGLAPEERVGLADLDSPHPYRIDAGYGQDDVYRIATSIWAESILADGLLGFDPNEGGAEDATLLGFVELGLDFTAYRSAMNRRVMQWSLGILFGVTVLSIMGLFWFHRALRPLHDLRNPLSRLASGNLEIGMEDAEHAELAAINDALASTINALHQRDREIREAANFDNLTGLPGRFGLNERLKKEIDFVASGPGRTSALLFLDLDQFKYVNDTVGHGAGDRLLIRVADHLRSLVSEKDLICRYGGDEFVVIRHGTNAGEAEIFADDVVRSMADIQFVEDGRAFNVRCSIGMAIVDGETDQVEEIMAQADLACHEAKGQGRNRYQVFRRDQGERERIATDMGWSDRIRDALENDGLSLRYQPIARVSDGAEYIYEVLLRMKGDGRNAIPPGAFLPAANRFGLMGDLDCWVIRAAFAQLAEIRVQRPDVVFSLNLSGIVFSDPRIVEYVIEQLSVADLPGSAIVFEVTEQVAIRYIEDASHIMEALLGVGCRFALDDFGSGFSSFNYLKRLPVDFIKIDGSFVENLATDDADRAIVNSIAEIGRALGTATIAEHVMDEETLEILRELGIDYAQGYFLGRPGKTVRRKPSVVA